MDPSRKQPTKPKELVRQRTKEKWAGPVGTYDQNPLARRKIHWPCASYSLAWELVTSLRFSAYWISFWVTFWRSLCNCLFHYVSFILFPFVSMFLSIVWCFTVFFGRWILEQSQVFFVLLTKRKIMEVAQTQCKIVIFLYFQPNKSY